MSHPKLNYVEFPAQDLPATKRFFEQVFGWRFVDYGPEYTAFTESSLQGGFYASSLCARTEHGSALLVFYTEDLQATLTLIKQSGGKVIRDVFDFPGGCRFHFVEPSGNEFAVWSEHA